MKFLFFLVGFDALHDDIGGHWGDSLGRNAHFSLPRHVEQDSEDEDRRYTNGKNGDVIHESGSKPAKDLVNRGVKVNGKVSGIYFIYFL